MSLGSIGGVLDSVPSSNQGAVINVAGVPMVWDTAANGYKRAIPFRPSGVVRISSIGDSIVRRAGGIALTACMQSGGKARYVINGGVSGNTTAQVLARLPTFLAANPSDICVIGCGTNDGRTGVTVETFESGVRGIISTCLSAGVTPVFTTCPPNSESGAFRTAIQANNRALQKVCRQSGILLSNRWAASNDGTFAYKSGFSAPADAIHPAYQTLIPEGAGLIADIDSAGLLPSNAGADVFSATDSVNLFTNATLQASASGLATGITNIGSFTPTIEAGTLGNRQVCTKAGNVTASGPRLTFAVVAGNKYRVRFPASYTVSGVTNGIFQTNNSRSTEYAYKFLDYDLLVSAGTFSFWYDEVFTAASTGDTTVTIYDNASGAASSMVIKMEQIQIINCTANPDYL
jgi:lysophospholipase L1-like esterase